MGSMMSTAMAVERYLGGKEALGVRPRSVIDWEALIHEGMPVQSVEVLKGSIAIPDSLLAALLGISEKTLSRARAAKGKLDPVASDRLFRVARVVALAIDVLEAEAGAVSWLKRPQIGLGGRIPLTMLTTDPGRDQVEKLLLRIEHGVYS
jgi:putative toxin-antitoxin system antitoxin component (TIGR02293 family)